MESPSKYTDLLAPRLPLTHWVAALLQPSRCEDGGGSLAHWSRFADGFAAIAVPGSSRNTAAAASSESTTPIAESRRPPTFRLIVRRRTPLGVRVVQTAADDGSVIVALSL